MIAFKLYNVAIAVTVCLLLAWRTQKWSSFWLLFPLLVMADSDVSWFAEHWYLSGSQYRWWRIIFANDLTYNFLVSTILTIFAVAVYRKRSREIRGAPPAYP